MVPRIIVADEPTSALDLSAQAQVAYLPRTVREELGVGILFISHPPAVGTRGRIVASTHLGVRPARNLTPYRHRNREPTHLVDPPIGVGQQLDVTVATFERILLGNTS